MTTPPAALPFLPVELLEKICSHFSNRPAILAPILLVNRRFNFVLTPHLYASIRLDSYTVVRKCTHILSSAPESASYQRDLAALVHSLYIADDECWRMTRDDAQALRHTLPRAIARMVSLRHLSCFLPNYPTTTVCTAIASAAPTLESLSVHLSESVQDTVRDGSDAASLSGLRPDFPNLAALEFVIPGDLPSPVQDFVQHILNTRAPHARSLAAVSDDGGERRTPRPALPRVCPALEVLELDAPTLTLPHAPALHTLRINWDARGSLPALSMEIFPNLEHLSCFWNNVEGLMAARDAAPRLRSVELDLFVHEREHRGYAAACAAPPTAKQLKGALAHLPDSVVDLSLLVSWLEVDELRELAPIIRNLESLRVMVEEEVVESDYDFLVRLVEFVAEMPHLHTLLISDKPHRTEGEDPVSCGRALKVQARVLRELSAVSATLRRVAFTHMQEWNRGSDGVWCVSDFESD